MPRRLDSAVRVKMAMKENQMELVLLPVRLMIATKMRFVVKQITALVVPVKKGTRVTENTATRIAQFLCSTAILKETGGQQF